MNDDVLRQVRQVHPELNIEFDEEIFSQALIFFLRQILNNKQPKIRWTCSESATKR